MRLRWFKMRSITAKEEHGTFRIRILNGYMFRIKKKWNKKRKWFMHSVVGWLNGWLFILFWTRLLYWDYYYYYNLLALANTYVPCLLFPFVMLINGFLIFHCIKVFLSFEIYGNAFVSRFHSFHSIHLP